MIERQYVTWSKEVDRCHVYICGTPLTANRHWKKKRGADASEVDSRSREDAWLLV